MGILEKAQEHYKSVLASDPKPIDIPEWGGRYFVRPQISVKKKMEIQSKLTSDKMDEGLALTLIYYLVDDNGDPCFKKLELVEIVRSVDPDVLIAVAGKIAELQPQPEDLEKN
jgi:hypothetical protein